MTELDLPELLRKCDRAAGNASLMDAAAAETTETSDEENRDGNPEGSPPAS